MPPPAGDKYECSWRQAGAEIEQTAFLAFTSGRPAVLRIMGLRTGADDHTTALNKGIFKDVTPGQRNVGESQPGDPVQRHC